MTTIRANLEHALNYAALGLHVFPCHWITRDGGCTCGSRRCDKPGKHPRTAKGYLDATTDRDQIVAWWQEWPRANIGMSCQASGVVVADIDPRHNGDETWARLRREDGDYPDTWTNLTGGGGVHYFYQTPAGFSTHRGTLGEGVDVKWKGYAILPPSRHASGREYAWEIESSPLDGRSPAPLPGPLLRRLATGEERTGADGERPAMAELLTRPCPEGKRNDTLASIAGWARNLMGQTEATALCQTWNRQWCRPPLDQMEVLRTVAGMYLNYPAPATVVLEDDEPEIEKPPIAGFEIIDAVDYSNRPPPRWLVDGVIHEESFFCVLGQPGSYKTFAALDLALSIGTGVPFLGHEVRQGAVLYICAEGAGGFGLRLKAWAKGREVEIPREALFILPGVVPLTEPEQVRALLAQVLVFGIDFKLVIIDTLSRSMPGADENAAKDMTTAVSMAGLIQQALRCAVGILHHGTKADGSIRGHSSLPGALDTIIKVVKDREIITLSGIKQKDGADIPPALLRPVVIDLTAEMPANDDDIEIAAPTNSVVLEPLSAEQRAEHREQRQLARVTPLQRTVAQALLDLGLEWATHRQWWDACELDRKQRQSFKNAQNTLLKSGLIRARIIGTVDQYQPAPALEAFIAATSQRSRTVKNGQVISTDTEG